MTARRGSGAEGRGEGGDVDPVRARRVRLHRQVRAAKRFGYLALLVAIVAFAVGVATEFASWTVPVTVAALVVATVVLPVPIVLGYGIRAAEREDRAAERARGDADGTLPPT